MKFGADKKIYLCKRKKNYNVIVKTGVTKTKEFFFFIVKVTGFKAQRQKTIKVYKLLSRSVPSKSPCTHHIYNADSIKGGKMCSLIRNRHRRTAGKLRFSERKI